MLRAESSLLLLIVLSFIICALFLERSWDSQRAYRLRYETDALRGAGVEEG